MGKGLLQEVEKKCVRLDTWGDNQKLIDYYQNCGFSFLGVITPQKTINLSKHYERISLSLFEIKLSGITWFNLSIHETLCKMRV